MKGLAKPQKKPFQPQVQLQQVHREKASRERRKLIIRNNAKIPKRKKEKSIVPNTFTRNHTWSFPKTKRKKGYHCTCHVHDSCEKIVFSCAANSGRTDWSRFTVSFHTKEEQPLEEDAGNTEKFFFLPRFFSPSLSNREVSTRIVARVLLCRKGLTLFTWIHKEG